MNFSFSHHKIHPPCFHITKLFSFLVQSTCPTRKLKMTSLSQEIVLTSSPEGPITAYDAFSGATIAHFIGNRSPRQGLALAGKSLIAASHISSTALGSIHLYNWWSSTPYHQLPMPEPVAPLATTPDGLYLFAGGLSGNIHTLTVPSGNILKSIPAHCKSVSCLDIIDDGSLLISGGDDGAIVVSTIFKLINVLANDNPSDFILHYFVAHAAPVTGITSTMGGCNSMIISCSLDCTCKFWSLLQGMHLRTVIFPCMILGVVLDPVESQFCAAGSDGFVYNGALKVVSRQLMSQGCELVTWSQKHAGSIVSMVMANQGQNLITASEDGGVWVWEVESGQVIRVLGNGMVSISEVVVAKGIGASKGRQVRLGSGTNRLKSRNLEFCNGEVSNAVSEAIEMDEALNMVTKDRSRAIDMLESVITMYERLLDMILKEAKGSSSSNSDEKDSS